MIDHLGEGAPTNLLVADDTATLGDLTTPRLELGLDQQDHLSLWSTPSQEGLSDRTERDEGEVGNDQVGDLIITESMHTRKAKMFEMSDAIVILPGGLGTLDEAFEVITWKQLRQHDKPVVLLNSNGYWDPFVALVESIVSGGFAHAKVTELFTVVDSVDEIFPALANAPEPDQVVLTSHL